MKSINRVDFFVILVVVLGLATVALRFGVGGGGVATTVEEEEVKAQVTFRVDNVRQETVSQYRLGDVLVSDETNHPVGPIVDIEVRDYLEPRDRLDGPALMRPVPGRYSVFVTVDANLYEKETGYYADGITEIKVFSDFILYTKRVKSDGKVQDIVFKE